jgi:hypothetical protein
LESGELLKTFNSLMEKIMNDFIVSNKDISIMLGEWPLPLEIDNAIEIGQILLDANYQSFNYVNGKENKGVFILDGKCIYYTTFNIRCNSNLQ